MEPIVEQSTVQNSRSFTNLAQAWGPFVLCQEEQEKNPAFSEKPGF